MTDKEQIAATIKFADEWRERGSERSEYQVFWLTLFRDVYGVDKPETMIKFEYPVDIEGTTHHIDALIPSTKVLIEQKSFGKDLTAAYEQAKRYADALDYSQRPRWIVTCNFQEFRVYDYNQIERAPLIVKLEDLNYAYKRLNSLVDPNDDSLKDEVLISKDAAEIIKRVYIIFKEYYRQNNVDNFKESLYKLCIRLVFCMYAEHSHIFAENQFRDYLDNFNRRDINDALQHLFEALNKSADLRGKNFDDVKNFPYVNGGLFEDNITLPPIDDKFATRIQRAFIIKKPAFVKFSWHLISPPIFGAMFESVIDSDDRRAGGMHYTSVENIHKVIDPLFMDDLDAEFKTLKHSRRNKIQRLQEFHDKLATLTFLDPACGSGNFLTETYLSLRRLENDVLRELMKYHCELPYNPVKVSIRQFYGIEINDFAVAIAQVALWIAENQMLQDTEMIVGKELNALPLKNYANIIKANALRVDWNEIVPRDKLNYIIGNPPFVGKSFQTKDQKSDMSVIFNDVKGYGNLDYVTSWYKKAVDFIANTKIRVAFVSTNSICQGIAVPPLWDYFFAQNAHVDFAHRTFKWLSESDGMAAVHCVIVAFSRFNNRKPKFIFDGDKKIIAKNINAYLLDAPNIIVENRAEALCDVPPMIVGSCPADGGYLIIEANEFDDFVKAEPAALKFIHPYIGSEEFIHNKQRYCLWLKDCPAAELQKMPRVLARVEGVKQFRLASKKNPTRLKAQTPTLFTEDRYVKSESFIVVPIHSSEYRKYIPIGYGTSEMIVNNALLTVPNAEIYHFGVLISNVHMAWMRVLCGRLESRYRYLATMVYNNFVWCEPSPAQKLAIESSAQNILDIRSRYENRSLAWLYNEATMPSDLREAHSANDRAVMAAYGFNVDMSEADIVGELMRMYQEIVNA